MREEGGYIPGETKSEFSRRLDPLIEDRAHHRHGEYANEFEYRVGFDCVFKN